jgi:hypothetical protein
MHCSSIPTYGFDTCYKAGGAGALICHLSPSPATQCDKTTTRDDSASRVFIFFGTFALLSDHVISCHLLLNFSPFQFYSGCPLKDRHLPLETLSTSRLQPWTATLLDFVLERKVSSRSHLFFFLLLPISTNAETRPKDDDEHEYDDESKDAMTLMRRRRFRDDWKP